MPVHHDAYVPKPELGRNEDIPFTPSHRGGINGKTLTLALSAASLILAVGGIMLSLRMYERSLKQLQLAQEAVQLELAKKTAVEAKYAEMLNSLEATLKKLNGDLAMANTVVATTEGDIQKLELEWIGKILKNPTISASADRAISNIVEPVLACLTFKSNESQSDYVKRCQGKDFLTVVQKQLPGITNILGPQTIIPPEYKPYKRAATKRSEMMSGSMK